MQSACRAVWRRCAGHWRAACGGVLPVTAPPVLRLLCVSAVRYRVLPHHASLCSGAVPQPSSVSSLRYTAALSPLPRRTLCTASPRCWSCQAVLRGPQLFCPSCSAIQPPAEDRDYYQLLDCERSFNVDIQDLQRKYRNLQRLLHPDYFSQKSQQEQDISDKQSSLVNKAYNTLLSPLSRGMYLLSLHGITITEGTEGSVEAPFLSEILELNEKLNDMSTEQDLEEMGTFVQDKCQSLTENVSKAFERGDLDGAKALLAKMKYYVNIHDQVKKKMVP